MWNVAYFIADFRRFFLRASPHPAPRKRCRDVLWKKLRRSVLAYVASAFEVFLPLLFTCMCGWV